LRRWRQRSAHDGHEDHQDREDDGHLEETESARWPPAPGVGRCRARRTAGMPELHWHKRAQGSRGHRRSGRRTPVPSDGIGAAGEANRMELSMRFGCERVRSACFADGRPALGPSSRPVHHQASTNRES
jgi:hypothetical protein